MAQEGNFASSEIKDKLLYSTNVELVGIYTGIRDAAVDAIRQGNVMGNPILLVKDSRYGLTPDVLVSGSPVHSFLSEALIQIKSAEPTAVCVEAPDLHMSLGEVFFDPKGRKGKLTSVQVKGFYKKIRDGISDFDPINLSLFGIIPTLDPTWEGYEKRSLAIVAAFLPDNNPAIYQLADEIQNSAQKVREQNRLEAEGPRVGRRKVLFVTLARLMKEPEKVGEEFSLLSLLDRLNMGIPKDKSLTVEKVNFVSTTSINYILPKGYVTIAPPVPLKVSERTMEEPIYLRPHNIKK